MEDIELLQAILKRCAEVRLTPMLWGKHGIGKSAIVRQTYEALGYEVVDLRIGQLEVGDLTGMPAHEYYCPSCKTSFGLGGNIVYCPICEQDHKKKIPIVGRTTWLPPWWYPQNGEKRCLFFDETNRGRLDVQQALFQIVLDYRIYQHPIPANCAIVCAANPSGGDYNVEEIDPALLNRFVNMKFTLPSAVWIKWAKKVGLQQEIIDFIDQEPKWLGNDPIEIPIEISSSPRGMEFLHKLISGMPRKYWQECANLVIGPEAAISFIQSIKTDIDKPVKAADIFNNWEKVEKQIEGQLQAKQGTRFDLLRVTLDELSECLKKGGSKKYKDAQLKNVEKFFLMIPQDLAFSILKDLAPEPDVTERLLLPSPKLFGILKAARKQDIRQ